MMFSIRIQGEGLQQPLIRPRQCRPLNTRPIKLITCRALAHLLKPMLPPEIEQVTLDISLHLSPERLRRTINQKIKEIEAWGVTSFWAMDCAEGGLRHGFPKEPVDPSQSGRLRERRPGFP